MAGAFAAVHRSGTDLWADRLWGIAGWLACPDCSRPGEDVRHSVDYPWCAARSTLAGGCFGMLPEDFFDD